MTADRQFSRQSTGKVLSVLGGVLLLVGLAALASGVMWLFLTSHRFSLNQYLLAGVVALIAMVAISVHAVHGFNERFQDFVAAERPYARFTTYALYELLGAACAFLFVLAALNLVKLWSSPLPLDRRAFVAFHIISPSLAPAVYWVLSLKVLMARTLDIQKRHVHRMAGTLCRLPIPDHRLIELESTSQPTPSETAEYFRSLDVLCQHALTAASVAGQYRENEVSGGAAVLFLADPLIKGFVQAASSGGSPAYLEQLRTFRPPFWNHREFRKTYNRFAKKRSDRTGDTLDRLRADFRSETERIASVTGVVFETQKDLVFNAGSEKHPLLFRSEMLDALSADQRPDFREVVGVPIVVNAHRLGVLLLLGNRTHSFYRGDAVYGTVRDMIAEAVRAGISFGHFRQLGSHNLFRHSLAMPDSKDVDEMVRIVNGVRSDFANSV